MNILDARNLCIEIEKFAPQYGYHVALTGGVLYKEGPRKDVDLILYGIRQEDQDREGFEAELENPVGLGFNLRKHQGWLSSYFYDNKRVDILYPDYKPNIFERVKNTFIFRGYGR